MEPTIYGMEIDPGMEIGDGNPDCCCGSMEKKTQEACTCCRPGDTDGAGTGTHTEYACDGCGTVVEVDGLGLVFDIRETQQA